MLGKSTIGLLLAGAALGQSISAGPEFEVASIKASTMTRRAAIDAGRTIGLRVNGTRVEIGLGSLTYLIATAYRVEPSCVSGPDWMATQTFEIQAKIPGQASKQQVPEMLQALLADRFNLRVHREPHQIDAYALLVGDEGPKMKEANAEAGKSTRPTVAGPGERMSIYTMLNPFGGANTISIINGQRTVFESERLTTHGLIAVLQRYLDRPLVDRTGLTGEYEVALDVPRTGVRARRLRVAAGALTPADTASDPDVSIFSTIKNLGLRLKQQKAAIDYIFVDHVEKVPTAN